MNTITSMQATPANYIHFHQPAKMVAAEYRDFLAKLLQNPSQTDITDTSQHSGGLILKFKKACDDNQNLRSTFYAAVRFAFEELKKGIGETPKRWAGLMQGLAKISENDPTMEKYIRDTLLGKSVPVLVRSQATTHDLQVASDILTVAGTHENLADALTPELMRPVANWHLALAKYNLAAAATRFATLRGSSPFAPIIAEIENKRGRHVDSIPLDHDPRKTLVVEFAKADSTVSVLVIDLSKPGRANHPREIQIDGDATPFKGEIAKLLLASTDLPQQGWVEPIATEAYCRLG